MANYCCATRSSYFYVTDEEKYRELMTHIADEGDLDFWDEKKENGKIAHNPYELYADYNDEIDDK